MHTPFSFIHHTAPPSLQKKQSHPRRWWKLYCISFLSILMVLAGYFGWFFWKTERKLDEPPVTTPQTNAAVIAAMQQTLAATEAAIETRTGTSIGQ